MMNKQSAGILGRFIAVICLLAALLSEAAEAQDRAPLKRVKELLSAGKPTIGVICQLPSAPWITLLSQAGFDWLWLDMEHGAVNIETVQLMVQATTGTPTVPLVRIP
jgi:2-keto-3-deoxy-L-rhamnonate aldolase RhmA